MISGDIIGMMASVRLWNDRNCGGGAFDAQDAHFTDLSPMALLLSPFFWHRPFVMATTPQALHSKIIISEYKKFPETI